MIGILLALTISWLLLYLVEKSSILVLGFLPIVKRLKQFLEGFLVTAVLCFSVQFLELLLRSSSWVLNDDLTLGAGLEMIYWDVKSVVAEELIFRGAILFILIKRIGVNRAILISATAFGVYHWFSFGIFGNIVPMVFVFIGTGLMGYAWALAFAKTRSILMPIGFHLGWNVTLNTIFSKGPLGQGIILTQGGHNISDWFSLIGLIGVPVLVLLFVKVAIPWKESMISEAGVTESAKHA